MGLDPPETVRASEPSGNRYAINLAEIGFFEQKATWLTVSQVENWPRDACVRGGHPVPANAHPRAAEHFERHHATVSFRGVIQPRTVTHRATASNSSEPTLAMTKMVRAMLI